MKNKITILILILIPSLGYSQESKAYLGISRGIAFPGRELGKNLNAGIDLGCFNFGYRFTEHWGTTLNFTASIHANNTGDIGLIVAFGLGPMYSYTFPDKKISWDIKPQLALRLIGFSSEDTRRGYGFILGNSINFGVSKGFQISVNLDYLTGKFTEIKYHYERYHDDDIHDLDDLISKLSLGVGFKYNF